MRRVVVTGLGAVTPCGVTAPSAWQTALSGRSAIQKITRFDCAELPVQIAGEVPEFGATELLGAKVARQTSRFVQFSAVAANEALQDAHYDSQSMGDDCGCLIGVAIGGLGEIEESACLLKERGASRISPLMLPYAIPNMASGFVAIEHRLRGPNFAIATACASGTHAIGEAARLIRDGETKMMLAGGAEAAICPLSIASFAKMRALSRRNDEPHLASRPFDRNRDGFVMGEGCGLLVLEEYEQAVKRGANIYAELVGYGLSADAHHITMPGPEGEGLARSIRGALASGQINPADVDYINAHGTSTPNNDSLETQAIQSVFGVSADNVSISSTKGVTGHCLGAAGGIEALFTVLAIKHDVVPPTANLDTPDPACPLDYTPNTARERNIKLALSNSSGFGGQNACLAFKKLA
ncbi:beta-ketoacyl-ACP synthase II [Novipirellula artificiosorum]|uniref:3-oxoacyl-[acyl-carrier-protein] synthase 2 n=1 Tax=Novipirellula artificiosorum TaxID=2528016 RepID=A0A5C6DSM9_9BACT|nr:beta-ketoacyl-ACP synthase II [Novipirellula artificiosorum]TWU39740.1 3-oxoacyl-[acyl-carrier-protein] synthase 2 [Novipirellula artificiosorum]